MLRRYIEYRERSLHSRDTNRKSLPFEWGLEEAGLQPDGSGRSPSVVLHDYVEKALRDSDSFYSYSPSADYLFDGAILKFPSAVETPYPENNVVWGRFFDGGKDLAVVVLPQWNCSWDGQTGLCRVLQRAGISALRLSMPYHHFRKPAHLERSEYLVSPNIGRTLTAARQAVIDTRRAGDWLLGRGHRRIGIVGTSIGSCIGFLTLAHDERFSTAAFIHVSAFFADVVWTGLSTRHVRRSLEAAIDLDELRRLWLPISPYPFVKRLSGGNRHMLALSGLFDLSFPQGLSRFVYDEFERCSLPCKVVWLPCGHYTMGKFPFSAIAGFEITKFLRKTPRRR